MLRGISKARTSIHSLRYHYIWCPKYRKKVLNDEVADRLETLIEEKADELDLDIIELAIQSDYVHLFISGHPKLAPSEIFQQIKGFSSRVLHEEYDFGLPSLWTRSYFVSSASEVSGQTIEAQTGQ